MLTPAYTFCIYSQKRIFHNWNFIGIIVQTTEGWNNWYVFLIIYFCSFVYASFFFVWRLRWTAKRATFFSRINKRNTQDSCSNILPESGFPLIYENLFYVCDVTCTQWVPFEDFRFAQITFSIGFYGKNLKIIYIFYKVPLFSLDADHA